MSSLTSARSRAVRAAGLGAALLVGLTACGTSNAASTAELASAEPALEVSGAWVRATVGTEDPSMTGAFMAIDNAGDEDLTLTGAASSVAGKVEIHEMAMVDGSMVMRRIDGGLTVQAGYGQVLMPGGNHLMLMGLTEELAAGDEVELTLEFSDGSSEELTVPVKEFTEERAHYHPSGSPQAHPSGMPMGPMQPSGSSGPSGASKP